MTNQDNKIPLYKRREDVLTYIAEHYPGNGFTGSELLCLVAWPWENEDELNEAISDMKWLRTDKTDPPKAIRIEQHDKTDYLAMMLAESISLDDYLNLNEEYLCGLLPLKYSGELYGEFSPGLFSDASLPIFNLGSSGGKLMEVIRSFFLNIYGQAALKSDKSIFDLDPFSEEALFSVSQNISEFKELFEEAERLDPRENETHRKDLTSHLNFLLICQRMCERQADMISESTDLQTSASVHCIVESDDIVSSDANSDHNGLYGRDQIMPYLMLSWNICKARMAEYGISRPAKGKWFLPWHIAVKIKSAEGKR